MKLNDQIIQSAEAKSKSYKLFDGQGLYIEISSKGSKFWRLKYRFEGKEKRISLGAYPEVSIDDAREHMRLCKEQLKGGIDPSQARKDSNQSITVPPKITSAAKTENLVEEPKSEDLSFKQITPEILDNESEKPDLDKGAFLDDLGAFDQKDDTYPQEEQKNAVQSDYESVETDQKSTPSNDAAILQVLNELKNVLAELRQENQLLKEQIKERDNSLESRQVNSDNQSGIIDDAQEELPQSQEELPQSQEELPQSQEELPQSQEELPQFTFIKTKKASFTRFFIHLKDTLNDCFGSIKAAFTQGANLVKQATLLLINFVKALVSEFISLILWILTVLKSFLSMTWVLIIIDRLFYKLGTFIPIIKQRIKQLFAFKPLSINLRALSITPLLRKIFSYPQEFIKSISSVANKIALFTLNTIKLLISLLGKLVTGFVGFATQSKRNMLYVILLTLAPLIIYLILQAFTSRDVTSNIIPIEGEIDPITIDDMKETEDFYDPKEAEVELPPLKADAPKADAPKADAPKADAPKADAPEADAPKADAPEADAPKADAPKADAPKAERKSTAKIIYPYSKDNNWKDSFNYVQVDYFTYYFRPNEYKPNLSDEAKTAFKAAAVNNIYLVVEGFSDARGDEQANLVAAKRRANDFTNQLYVLGFNKEQIIGTFYDAPKISAECVEPMCSFYRKTHVSVYVKKEFYEELKERAKLKQINQEALEKSQQAAPAPKQAAPAPKQAAPAPKQAAPAPKQAAPAPKQAAPAPKQAAPSDKVSTIDFSGLTNPMPNLIDGYRLTARLTYYFGLYESMPNLDDNMVKNLKELFNKPDQKFAIEGFENLSDDPNQDIQIAQGRAVMMKDELIKLGLAKDRILGVFYNVPQESKGCVEIGCAKGRRVVINLFNK